MNPNQFLSKSVAAKNDQPIKSGQLLQQMLDRNAGWLLIEQYISMLLKIEHKMGIEVVELRDVLFSTIEPKHLLFNNYSDPNDVDTKALEIILRTGVHPNRIKNKKTLLQCIAERWKNDATSTALKTNQAITTLIKLLLFYDADPFYNLSITAPKNDTYCQVLFNTGVKTLNIRKANVDKALVPVVTMKSMMAVMVSFVKKDGLFGVLPFDLFKIVFECLGKENTHFKDITVLKKLQNRTKKIN